jgi:hypothetical protein
MPNTPVPAAVTGLPTARRAAGGEPDAELRRLCAEFDAAWHHLGEVRHVLAIAEESEDRAAIDAAERLEDAANERVTRANRRITATPATTIEGLKMKALVLRVNEDSWADEMLTSLISDILALRAPALAGGQS